MQASFSPRTTSLSPTLLIVSNPPAIFPVLFHFPLQPPIVLTSVVSRTLSLSSYFLTYPLMNMLPLPAEFKSYNDKDGVTLLSISISLYSVHNKT
jgi:hypothetical protein